MTANVLASGVYYLGWTYLGTEEKATAEDYDKMMQNIRGMM